MPTLALSLAQSAFQSGEPVLGTLTLRNADGQPIKVNARLAINAPFVPPAFREVVLTVTDVFGRQLTFQPKVNVGLPEARDFKLLVPGAAVEVPFDLALYYDLSQPGSYKVYATYQAQLVPETPAAGLWTDELKSPAVSFTVRA